MQVDHERKPLLRLQLQKQLLQVVDGGVQLGVGAVPSPVEVRACQRRAVVPVDDAVGVEHRGHDEHKRVAEQLCHRVIAGQEEQDAFHHPAGVRLTGVDARADDATRSPRMAGHLLLGRDSHHVAAVPSDGLCEELALQKDVVVLRRHVDESA
eukprot:scaffold494_cov245-Pinguiococcus_pyrenoidosus.AAC.8